MSEQVIRDVIINIRLKQLDNKLKVPDTRGAQTAISAVTKELEKTAAAQAKTSSAITAAVQAMNDKHQQTIAIHNEVNAAIVSVANESKKSAAAQAKKSEKFKEISKSEKVALGKRIVAERELQKQIEKTRKINEKAASTFKKIQEAERASVSKRQAAVQQQQTNAKKVVEQNIKAAESFRTMGDGAFTVARGAALLFSDTDEGMKKLVERIALVQGGFDLFRGGIDIVKGFREGIIAWTTASKAAAVANTAVAASNTAVATTAGTATVATRGLKVALGPLGIVLAGLGAAYAVFIAMQGKSAAASRKEAQALRDKAKADEVSRKQLEKSRQLRFEIAQNRMDEARSENASRVISGGSQINSTRSFIREERSKLKGLKEIEVERKKLNDINQRQADLDKRFDRGLSIRTGFSKEGFAKERESRFRAIEATSLEVTDRDRQEYSSRKAFLEDRINTAVERAEGPTGGFFTDKPNSDLRNKAIRDQKLLLNLNREQQGIERLRIVGARRLVEIQEASTKKAEQQLKTAKELVATEEARVKSVESSIHRLDPEKKARLKDISAKPVAAIVSQIANWNSPASTPARQKRLLISSSENKQSEAGRMPRGSCRDSGQSYHREHRVRHEGFCDRVGRI